MIDNLKWIFIKRHKTDIPSNVPILPPALIILNKYLIQNNINGIFPMISNQKTNRCIKRNSSVYVILIKN